MLAGVVERIAVPPVDEDGRLHLLFVVCQRILLDLRPVGQDEAEVGALDGFVDGGDEVEVLVLDAPLEVFAADRIVGIYLGAIVEEDGDVRERRGFAEVVGAGLEREAEDGDFPVVQVFVVFHGLAQELCLLVIIDLDGSLDGLEFELVVRREPVQGFRVLREAAAAVADTGAQEAVADARVVAHAFRDVIDIRADVFAEVRDLVDVADLDGEEIIRRVLDHLGAAAVRDELWRGKIGVKLCEDIACRLVLDAEHDARSVERVVDSRALRKEFGIRGDVKRRTFLRVFIQIALDALVRPDGHGRFHNDNTVARDARGDLVRDIEDVVEIRRAVALLRRADADEDDISIAVGGRIVCRIGQTLSVLLHERFKVFLVDEGFMLSVQILYFSYIYIDARHVVSMLREANGRNKANIPHPCDCDLQETFPAFRKISPASFSRIYFNLVFVPIISLIGGGVKTLLNFMRIIHCLS